MLIFILLFNNVCILLYSYNNMNFYICVCCYRQCSEGDAAPQSSCPHHQRCNAGQND